MPQTKDPVEVEAPKTFAHLEGYPPLEGENLQQYLKRINPLLDQAVRTKKSEASNSDRYWLALLFLAIVLLILMGGIS